MTFTIPTDPSFAPTSQQKGIRVVKGVPMFYKKKALLDFERLVTHAMDEARGDYRIPDKTPIYLHIVLLFPFPKGCPKSKRVDMSPMTERPDGDNLAKAIIDCLGDRFAKGADGRWHLAHEGFFSDDAAITPLVISKFRTTGTPRIIVTVRPRTPTPDQP